MTERHDGDRGRRRPLIERIGMAFVAVVIATLFGGIAVAAWVGGEGFLAVMGAIGSVMTLWAAGLTPRRHPGDGPDA